MLDQLAILDTVYYSEADVLLVLKRIEARCRRLKEILK